MVAHPDIKFVFHLFALFESCLVFEQLKTKIICDFLSSFFFGGGGMGKAISNKTLLKCFCPFTYEKGQKHRSILNVFYLKLLKKQERLKQGEYNNIKRNDKQCIYPVAWYIIINKSIQNGRQGAIKMINRSRLFKV